ncbi:sulfatase-like hydrolase/transferase [Paenibacillus validus]|uniref:sulfatase-like hydrolase/transferase n=1 Tax=Paenibacillus TaxID=44249 RepID=UPI000FDA5A27|nr:sulfatase-like hydrolase/transferase [Paenibacillus validus]MED4602288.1 sulfatase-like hydrolase/transferase [Paenibacillus validus]MED4608160.1 sulfatase-like hydrolase/transferase [Paenibacillus validus]
MRDRQSAIKRPNILFLIADDHRFDGIGAYGNPVVKTPTLDQLAATGVLYESIYTMGGQTAALCVPSRACLLTGANVFKATVTANEVSLGETENPALWALNPALATLPETFRREGYRTFGIGKWHNGKESFARSFSGGAKIFIGGMADHTGLALHDYDPTGLYPAEAACPDDAFSSELFAEAAIDFIRGYQEDDPFFLYVAFTAPHDPRTPPKAYSDLYPAGDIPLPENFWTEHPFDNGESDVRDERLASFPRAPSEIRQHLADYYGMITHLDTQIGRIFQALDERNQTERTIVVYTADHGLALGQHGLLGKQNVYEHSIHVPLIMRGPGLPQGVEVGGLGCQIDIFPTLSELTKTPLPDTVEGRSLIPLISGEKTAIRESVFSVYKNYQRMISDGRWKFIRYYRSEGKGTDLIQLFDLFNDPWEIQNLAEDSAQHNHIRRLEEELLRWQISVGDPILHQ